MTSSLGSGVKYSVTDHVPTGMDSIIYQFLYFVSSEISIIDILWSMIGTFLFTILVWNIHIIISM